MKAVKCLNYGGPEVLSIEEIEKPMPKDNEILVRVKQSIVTPTDVSSRKGSPFIVRLFTGIRNPKMVLGSDYVGIVEDIGENTTLFNKGDRVFGSTEKGFGANAEYICVKENYAVSKAPSNIANEYLSGICDAAMTALTFIRDDAKIKKGDHILINGASGSIGTYAVQLAKMYGAEVTAVCSTKNHKLVRELGADHVIDYHKEDFTKNTDIYDVIFDTVYKRSFSESKKSLKSGGIYLTTGPSKGIYFDMLTTMFFGKKRAKMSATGLNQTKEKLEFLKGLLKEDELKTVVDRKFKLEEIQEAHKYVEKGHKTGNVVLIVREES